jgi:hypothetical protein
MQAKSIAWVFYGLIAAVAAVYLSTGSLAGSALAWVVYSAIVAGAAVLLAAWKPRTR